MSQGALDFRVDVAEVTRSPTGEMLPPFQGRTIRSRHASYTGAVAAQERRSAHITALREVWREPLTLNEAAAKLSLPLSSICSLKSAIEDEIEVVDLVTQDWPNGRRTKRCRWRLRA